MPIQIIDRIKPSAGERLSGAMDKGMQYLGTNLENKAIERNIGMDLSGIQDPSTRQQLIADQLKYGRQQRQSQQVPGAMQAAQDTLATSKLEGPSYSSKSFDYPEETQSQAVKTRVEEQPTNEANQVKPSKTSSGPSVEEMGKQYVAETRPDLINPSSTYGAVATFDAPLKSDLRPEEEAKIRADLTSKRVAPDVQDQVINNVRGDIQTRFNEAQLKYGFDKEKLGQLQTKWNNFTQIAPQNLAPFISQYEGMPQTQDLLKNKYFQYAASLPVTSTPEQMHSQSKAMLDQDINKINQAQAIPAMPPIRSASDANEYLNPVKNVYKDMVENGLMEAAKEDAFINKDMGNEEFHSAVWGDQTSKDTLNKIHALKPPSEYTSAIKGDPVLKKYNSSYPKERNSYISSLSKELKGISPTDDLVLLRAMVLDNGGTIKDFTDALNQAESSGLKLSQFQKSQRAEIEIPRHPPLWELFSEPEEKGYGVFGAVGSMLNWKPFINYLRGKK